MRRWSILPDRVREHPVITALYYSRAKHNAIAAGRRGFKSESEKRKLIHGTDYHPGALTKEDARFFAAAPTYGQAKKIFWDHLKVMTRPFWRGDPSESELVIRLCTGSEIHVVGVDKPERIEGSPWNGGVIDEYANTKPGLWFEHVVPLMVDFPDCWIDISGAPDYIARNAEEYRTLYEYGFDEKRTLWSSFTWRTSEVQPAHVVEELRANTSELGWLQEFEALWVSPPGAAYYAFEAAQDVEDVGIIEGVPVCVSCDFNVGNHVWCLSQFVPHDQKDAGGQVEMCRVFRQVHLQNASVEDMCKELRRILPDWALSPGMLVFYGDSAGNQRRAEAPRTAWQTIKSEFPEPIADHRVTNNPRISDRLEAVNAQLSNSYGVRGVKVDRSVTMLTADFTYVTRPMLYSENKSGERTHASDGIGYMLYKRKKDRGYAERLERFSELPTVSVY